MSIISPITDPRQVRGGCIWAFGAQPEVLDIEISQICGTKSPLEGARYCRNANLRQDGDIRDTGDCNGGDLRQDRILETPAQGVSERRLTAPSTSASTAGNAALLVLPLARRLARHHAPCFEHSVYLLDRPHDAVDVLGGSGLHHEPHFHQAVFQGVGVGRQDVGA